MASSVSFPALFFSLNQEQQIFSMLSAFLDREWDKKLSCFQLQIIHYNMTIQNFIHVTYQSTGILFLATHNNLIELACVKNLCWIDGMLQMLLFLLCWAVTS